MRYTKFRTLTDSELFSVIQTARRHSPIIEELAGRLERADAQNQGHFLVLFAKPNCWGL